MRSPTASRSGARSRAVTRRQRCARAGQDHFTLTLWTDDPQLAARAGRAGVDRIGPDLELLGKWKRQKGLGYRVSGHSLACLPQLREQIRPGALFVRTNPVHPGIQAEVDRALLDGVDVLMVPMVRSAEDVDRFVDCVSARARVVVLLEHIDAMEDLDQILAVPGVDEVHIGLNDLALSIGLPDRFTLLGLEWFEQAMAEIRAAGLPLGIGGIGRVDDASLPIAPDLIYAQIVRLGAGATLLARSFVGRSGGAVLTRDIASARRRLRYWTTLLDEGMPG